MFISASIVLYHTPKEQIDNIISSLFKSEATSQIENSIVNRLFIIDNSPSEENNTIIESLPFHSKIEYIPHKNTGYGSSHNIAIQKAIELNSDYHIILNPDIYFESIVLDELIHFMDANPDTGYVLPRVVYPNGELQYLCKLLPTPFDLIFRRFLPKTKRIVKHNELYELKHSGYDKIMNPPCLSGCFMFLRVSVLKEYSLFFDDSFFMYCEDFDLIRRIHRVAKTIYYPNVTIIHDHAQESYKNSKMLMIHIESAIHYFNKWGWFFDKERRVMNKNILKEIEEINKSQYNE